ncbi:MAG: deoxyribodipyrimidine photo-lyase [Rhodospirillaceae bacterium TMED63]|nr:MAG: deoxyribodipyrimidine photo-lyase [Rhodospirillaceae bacterium TMED63]
MHEVVWFKRDLRVTDHRPLVSAAEAGLVLPLYIVETELWQQADMSVRHWDFIAESLVELRENLKRCGQPLVVRTGDVVDVLDELRACGFISGLWSHQETGNNCTYQRDLKVGAWCREHNIKWHEVQNHGVSRPSRSRNGWSKRWDKHMGEEVAKPPNLPPVNIDLGTIPTSSTLAITEGFCPVRQSGGSLAAKNLLESFLSERGETYRTSMSSPLSAEIACSRLSPHISWGTISMREVNLAVKSRQTALKNPQPGSMAWRQSLKSFNSRLHWHCHFIQKLEDEPQIEFENLHSGYDGVRKAGENEDALKAWAAGETGLPFVDACMRYLRENGWLNFRMRAMLMAVASYHLWLHWREPGLELARLFTDYEPGIHWSQVQMQSGTTGINTIRIYNPVKQGKDQDPAGVFIRKWVPELSVIPDVFLHEPWKAENSAQVLGSAYPYPIVDYLDAAKAARQRVWAVRRSGSFREQADKIQDRHGSRKSGVKNPSRRATKGNKKQLTLPV